jgi:hypothetical protein
MTATLLIAVLPLIGLGLCVWALCRAPVEFLASVGLLFMLMLSLNWIA